MLPSLAFNRQGLRLPLQVSVCVLEEDLPSWRVCLAYETWLLQLTRLACGHRYRPLKD